MRFGGRAFRATLLLLMIGTASAAGVHRYHSRPQASCALPKHDYMHRPPMPMALAVTNTGVLLRQPDVFAANTNPVGPAAERVAHFQLATSAIQLNHCSLSRVEMALRDSGAWTLSLRADQNPRTPIGPPPPPRDIAGSTASVTQTSHILRNPFFVRVRGYGAFQVADPGLDSSPGRPVIFDFALEPFWVQRGAPEFKTIHGAELDPHIAHDFALIDRIEVELRYQ
jgi:hypothetical protein